MYMKLMVYMTRSYHVLTEDGSKDKLLKSLGKKV